jgi:hypothetical protein
MKLVFRKQVSGKGNLYTPWSELLFCLISLIFFSACATSSAKYSVETLEKNRGQTKMLFMPLDMQLYEISVGGVPELKAEWTEKGKKNVSDAVNKFLMSNQSLSLAQFNSSENESEAQAQLFRLFGVVGEAIYLHYHHPYNALPSKKEFQWSLGDTTDVIRDEYGADYALFVRMNDQFSSGGRVALGIITGALFGVVPHAGMQTGFAYLVDTKTGEVVWFNFLRSASFGDVREPESAKKAIATLLSEFPK